MGVGQLQSRSVQIASIEENADKSAANGVKSQMNQAVTSGFFQAEQGRIIAEINALLDRRQALLDDKNSAG